MIKGIIKFFRNLWEKEIDYEFEIEFSIYDILFVILILFFVWKIFVKQKYCSGKEALHTTAVTRNGEKCGKFTFIFRKKFYLSRKYAVPKFATSCSRETLNAIYFPNLRRKLFSYFFRKKFIEIVTEKSCAKIENRTELCR